MCFWNYCALLSFCMFTGRKHSICQGNDGELLCVHVHVLCYACAGVVMCVCMCVYVCLCEYTVGPERAVTSFFRPRFHFPNDPPSFSLHGNLSIVIPCLLHNTAPNALFHSII